ncbi:molybdopterin oxidoreductase [Desulfobacula toluolica Tol2]|nr:molybdopterin oxidoreductase [Desulfobacula toluolica Tol2]
MTNSIAEIEDADCLLVVGSNTTEAHPLIAYRIFKAKAKNAKLIVVDPRKIQLTNICDIHIRLKFGTDIAFINGVMHEIIKNNLHDEKFIANRTEDFEALKETVKKYTPEHVSKITGVSVEDIKQVAKIYATSKNSSILYTLGITEHSHGVDNVKTLANLTMLTGQIGKKSSGVNPLRGQNNVQGACDMGALPNVYPGYQAVTDQSVCDKFQEAWGTELSKEVGKTIPDIMDGLIDGSVKGLYIFGENSVEGDPNTDHVRRALESAEFLVVHDIFLTSTAQMADVVLPGGCWAEVDGTFTNSERRVQRIRKAVEPPGEALPNWKIFSELGTRLGVEMKYDSAEEIFQEMTKLTPSFAGISYDRIDTQGIQWPCPSSEHPGTTFLHQGKFTRGKGKFHAIEHQKSKEEPDSQYPFTLTTGRRYAHYNTSSMTGRCKTLINEFPAPVAQINIEDAKQMGLNNGDQIKVSSRRGEVVTPISIGDVVPKGAIFMDFHFKNANSNKLLGTFLDPVSKTPDYKVCAVQFEKHTP